MVLYNAVVNFGLIQSTVSDEDHLHIVTTMLDLGNLLRMITYVTPSENGKTLQNLKASQGKSHTAEATEELSC
jgi:hypothetical protein